MTRYNYKGFYGDYGHIVVHNDGTQVFRLGRYIARNTRH